MRNVPKALFGSLSDQKKLERSMVFPHSDPDGWDVNMLPMSVMKGSEKVGLGEMIKGLFPSSQR